MTLFHFFILRKTLIHNDLLYRSQAMRAVVDHNGGPVRMGFNSLDGWQKVELLGTQIDLLLVHMQIMRRIIFYSLSHRHSKNNQYTTLPI